MSIRINIENILKSPNATFFEIIKVLTEKNISNCKKELNKKNCDIDTVLYDAITLVLSNLNNEVGYIDRLLYRLFNFEVKKNVRREQLIILGSQLKAEHSVLRKNIYIIESVIESLNTTLKNLTLLQRAFQNKNKFILNQDILKKSQLYINQIEIKILKLEEYQGYLRNRLNILRTNEKIIGKLLKKIPRYNELKEETYLQLSI